MNVMYDLAVEAVYLHSLFSEKRSFRMWFIILSTIFFVDAIEILYEKKATPEQVEQARKLQLPDNFYLYKDAPPCPGCPGCKDESKSEEVRFNEGAIIVQRGEAGTKPIIFSQILHENSCLASTLIVLSCQLKQVKISACSLHRPVHDFG